MTAEPIEGYDVWLSLDVEKAQNAPYKKAYGVDALPMYFIVDPKTEKVALRWVGGFHRLNPAAIEGYYCAKATLPLTSVRNNSNFASPHASARCPSCALR